MEVVLWRAKSTISASIGRSLAITLPVLNSSIGGKPDEYLPLRYSKGGQRRLSPSSSRMPTYFKSKSLLWTSR